MTLHSCVHPFPFVSDLSSRDLSIAYSTLANNKDLLFKEKKKKGERSSFSAEKLEHFDYDDINYDDINYTRWPRQIEC